MQAFARSYKQFDFAMYRQNYSELDDVVQKLLPEWKFGTQLRKVWESEYSMASAQRFVQKLTLKYPTGVLPPEAEAEIQTTLAYRNTANSIVHVAEFAAARGNSILAHSLARRAMFIQPNSVQRSVYEKLKAEVNNLDSIVLERIYAKRQKLCVNIGIVDWRTVLEAVYYRQIYHTCRMEDNNLTLEQIVAKLKGSQLLSAIMTEIEQQEDGGGGGEGGNKNDEANRAAAAGKCIDVVVDVDVNSKMDEEEAAAGTRDYKEIVAAAQAFATVFKAVIGGASSEILDCKTLATLNVMLLQGIDARAGKYYQPDEVSEEEKIQLFEYIDPDVDGSRATITMGGTSVSNEEIEKTTAAVLKWIHGKMCVTTTDGNAQQMDAVTLAALAHFLLVAVHPFADGNGRLSRLIMNYVLMMHGFPPVIIPARTKAQKERYNEALNVAHNGDCRSFIRFVANCLEQTIDQISVAMARNPLNEVPRGIMDKDSIMNASFCITSPHHIFDADISSDVLLSISPTVVGNIVPLFSQQQITITATGLQQSVDYADFAQQQHLCIADQQRLDTSAVGEKQPPPSWDISFGSGEDKRNSTTTTFDTSSSIVVGGGGGISPTISTTGGGHGSSSSESPTTTGLDWAKMFLAVIFSSD